MLEPFALDLHRCDDKGVAKEVTIVTNSFARLETVNIKQLFYF